MPPASAARRVAFEFAQQHVVKLRELGRCRRRANNGFALGGIEVNVNRSHTDRSFHLGGDGGVALSAEPRDQLGCVAGVYPHTGHSDVAPQRHTNVFSPAKQCPNTDVGWVVGHP